MNDKYERRRKNLRRVLRSNLDFVRFKDTHAVLVEIHCRLLSKLQSFEAVAVSFFMTVCVNSVFFFA